MRAQRGASDGNGNPTETPTCPRSLSYVATVRDHLKGRETAAASQHGKSWTRSRYRGRSTIAMPVRLGTCRAVRSALDCAAEMRNRDIMSALFSVTIIAFPQWTRVSGKGRLPALVTPGRNYKILRPPPLQNYWTTTVPRSMFIPHTKPISPLDWGVNSMTTGSLSGNVRRMSNEGNTTSLPHVLSVVRTNVIRAGVPVRSATLLGS